MIKRILVVEDDLAIQQLVGEVLREAGYEVDLAGGGREGLERARTRAPDLILLDKLMPNGDGTSFASAYRSETPRPAPILGLCASRDADGWARTIGAVGLVTKPFDIDDLLAAVRAAEKVTR